MKNIRAVGAAPFVVIGCLWAVSTLVAAQEDRITGPIDGNRAGILKGNLPPMAAPANDRGALDPSTHIGNVRIALNQTAAQAADLESLLEAQRDPASPDYHRWLRPEEYGERFGVSLNDLERLSAWLESQGFAIEQVARARNWIAFSGSAGQIGTAFRTELRRYQVNRETHFANASEPWIPEALAGMVSGLYGLDDFRPKPPRTKTLNPSLTTSSGAHYLAPDDLAAIYDISPLYQAGFDGTGQKLAIAGQTDINLADIRGFRAQFGLPAKDPQLVRYGSDPGVSSGDQIEADLDLEWAGAVARNATIIYVYSQNVFESVQYAIDQNLAPVISMSYGGCEIGAPASYRSMAQQANAEGITWMNSSGDSGAAGCDWEAKVATQGPAVSFPAGIPEVTAVGGTEFNETGSAGWSSQNSVSWASATSYIPEKAWNDTALGSGIWSSGGGASVLFAKPWWQAGPGVPNDNARDVPDVSLSASGAHDGYLIYASGGVMVVGGTSASSPSFAGIVTLLNQYVVAKGIQAKPGLGNINPNLYGLAQTSTGVIHDITAGDNIVPCASGSTGCTTGSFGYTAGLGYDLVTGLGSVDAYNLVTKWSSVPPAIGATMTLTASPGSIAPSGSVQLTAKISAVTGSAGPSGSVAFTAGGTALGSAAAIVSGTTAMATLTAKGSSLAVGANGITATYIPTANFSGATASATVTVTVPLVATKTTVIANPISIAATGTTQLTATVTPASGNVKPTGTVTFLVGSTSLGTATLAASGAAATATLSVTGGKLAAGANSITASYSGNGSFAASVSASATLTVAAPLIAATVSIAASPASIAQSAATVLTATVKPASGTAAPTGSVIFAAGSASLGSAALVASGATATATLTVKGANLAAGANAVIGSYGGDSKFSASMGSVTVSVATSLAATTTVVAASPPSIAQNATTQLTAMVKSTTTPVPAGTVNFSIGTTSLGSATLTVSGGMAAAVLSVAGSELALGNNSITASYGGSGSFAASTASIVVIVTGPTVATSTSVTASPANIAQSASTQLTVTVKAAAGAAAGAAAPTGSVSFTSGASSLGTAALVSSGATATATLTVKGSSLVVGSSIIEANYLGSGSFSGSTGSVTVGVVSPAASNVVVTAAKTTSTQAGFPVKIQLQEQAGAATTLTGFTINGTNFASAMGAFFGTTQIAAHGTLSATLVIQWTPLPANLVFVFTGADGGGRQWSQTVSLATK